MQTMREGFTHAAAEAEIARRLKAGECALLVGAKPAAVKLAEPTVADLCDPAYTPPAKPAPAPPATPAPPLDDLQAGEQRVNAEIAALLGYLADARAVLSLAEETLQQIADGNARLREQRKALRARVLRVLDEL